MSVEFIVVNFKNEKLHFSTWSPCLPIHFVHLSTSFFFQSQNSVYIFPHIFASRGLCPRPTSCPSWEYHWTRHLIFNCFDSCSLGVLMCSYIHAYVYFTTIYDLLLFPIAERSQFLVTIFIQAQLLYLYSIIVLY